MRKAGGSRALRAGLPSASLTGTTSGPEPSNLDISGLTVRVGDRRELFSGFNLRVDRGESVAVVGRSGSGKTTLLNAIIGTVVPTAGRVLVCGSPVVGASRRELRRIRSKLLGIVFQHGELIGELSPLENVVVPGLLAGRSVESVRDRAHMLLEHFGVPTHQVSADQVSGGERQRTALARALMNEPPLLLADEPTGSLDAVTRDQVSDVLFAAPREWGCALVVVTHDPQVACRADRVVELAQEDVTKAE